MVWTQCVVQTAEKRASHCEVNRAEERKKWAACNIFKRRTADTCLLIGWKRKKEKKKRQREGEDK